VADAIEKADIVLICMSQKYKDSPYCRLEGEYCVNHRVPFIPLMMQNGYHPDGWCVFISNFFFLLFKPIVQSHRLGLVLGSKLYYDFSEDHDWEAKIAELVKGM
jgi:hypothetical protein